MESRCLEGSDPSSLHRNAEKKIQYPAGRSRANLHRSTNEAGKLEDLSAVSGALGRSRVFSSEDQESGFTRCYLADGKLVGAGGAFKCYQFRESLSLALVALTRHNSHFSFEHIQRNDVVRQHFRVVSGHLSHH